jgi:hypothetical protein
VKLLDKTLDGLDFEVGYELVPDDDKGTLEPLFWLETKQEVVTIAIEPKMLRCLARGILFLADSLDEDRVQ